VAVAGKGGRPQPDGGNRPVRPVDCPLGFPPAQRTPHWLIPGRLEPAD